MNSLIGDPLFAGVGDSTPWPPPTAPLFTIDQSVPPLPTNSFLYLPPFARPPPMASPSLDFVGLGDGFGVRADEAPATYFGPYGVGPLDGFDGRFEPRSALETEILFSSILGDNAALDTGNQFSPFLGDNEILERGSQFSSILGASAIGAWRTEKYAREHASHSTDSLIYNPSAVLFPQPQLGNTSVSKLYDNPETGCSFAQYVNPLSSNFDYFNDLPVMQTVPPVLTEQEQECSVIKSDSSQEGISPTYSSRAIAGSSIHGDCGNWKSMEQPSGLIFGERISNMNLLNSNNSCYFLTNMDKAFPLHSTSLDQQNVVVDSPCWKGSASRNYRFGVDNNAANISVAKSCEVQDPLDQDENIAVSTQCTESSMLHKDQNDISSLHGTQFSSVGPVTYPSPKVVEGESTSSNKLKFSNADITNSVSKTREHRRHDGEQIFADFGTMNSVMKSFNNIPSPIQVDQTAIKRVCCSHLGLVDSSERNLYDPTAAFSAGDVTDTSLHGVDAYPKNSKLSESSGFSSEGNAQSLVKAILTMSEILLSSVHGDVNMLKADDLKLLRLVIDNLEGLAFTGKKDSIGESCHVSGIQSSLLQAEIPSSEEHSKLKDSTGITKTINDTDFKFNNYQPDEFALKGIASNYRRCMAKAIEEISKENFFEPEDDSQALLYKNLWIEAEVSLCRLKYDLQFTRMKLEMQKNMPQEANLKGSSDAAKLCSDSSKLTDKKSMEASVLSLDSRRDPFELDHQSTDNVHSSVMARLNVLKGRSDYLDADNSLEENPKSQESVNSWSFFEKEGSAHQKANLDKSSDADQRILQPVRLADLEPLETTIDECDKLYSTAERHTINKMKVYETSNDSTHSANSVMARFKILKRRIDNFSTDNMEHPVMVGYCLDNNEKLVGEENNDKAHQVSDDKEHGVDNILKRQVDKFLDSNPMDGHPINPGYCLNTSKMVVHEGNSEKEQELDGCIASRLKILKERRGNVNSNTMEEHPINAGYCLESDGMVANERSNNEAHAVDVDSVKARFEILKGRMDNSNSNIMEENLTTLHGWDYHEMILPQYFSAQVTPVSNFKSVDTSNFGSCPVNQQPYSSGDFDYQNSITKCKPIVQHFTKEHDGSMDQSGMFSDCIKIGSESGYVSTKLATPFYASDWHSSRVSSGVSSNILSDWEHILEDELK